MAKDMDVEDTDAEDMVRFNITELQSSHSLGQNVATDCLEALKGISLPRFSNVKVTLPEHRGRKRSQ